jgi:hypothetical protein
MNSSIRLIFVVFLSCLALSSHADEAVRQYTFAWPYADESLLKPRGGTTKGTEIKLDQQAGPAWQALRDPNISELERDRRAILAMAGAYRASFDFLETVGFEAAPYQNQRPYQSWGTEYVYVIADQPEFISLQHILVMQIKLTDGSASEPMVVKHWRQDWTYEDRSMHAFRGNQTWLEKKLSRREARGHWTQAVFQVDDSPRYESYGQWQHWPNYSTWESDETWRPLPRREFTVRKDYDVLIGENRHTITPLGWIHEEANLKARINAEGEVQEIISKEAGFNRYERIVDFDFSAGDEYWSKTSAFWLDVADAWRDIYAANQEFTLSTNYDEFTLIGEMFGHAAQIGESYDQEAGRAFIQATLDKYVIRGE